MFSHLINQTDAFARVWLALLFAGVVIGQVDRWLP